MDFPPGLPNPSQASCILAPNTRVHTSPLTNSEQSVSLPGSVWKVSYGWGLLLEPQWRRMSAFVAGLGGTAGRFNFSPLHAPRRATGTGTPVIDGANQLGTTLNLRGWAPGAQAFLAGDFLSYVDTSSRPRLHIALADAIADVDGKAAVLVAPPLRRPGNDGAPVEIAAPYGIFRLATNEDGEVQFSRGSNGSIAMDLQEALF